MEDNNALKANRDRFGSAWQERAKQVLGKIPFDAGLGQEAARDAQRLVSGELSEEEFYLKYHSAYLKEFGLDMRPLALDRSRDEILADSFLKGPVDRRTLLKVAGGGVLALSLNNWLGRLTALAAPRDDIPRPTPVQYGMLVDLEKCDGCLACVAACKAHNALDEAVYWLHIIAYTDANQDKVNLLPRLCNHCTNAPCVKVCPVAARFKRDDGLVLIDYDLCIGCRYCMVACPYGVNYFGWDEPRYKPPFHTVSRGRWVAARPPRGVMGKCDFCPERQDNPDTKGTAICAMTCPHGVLQFGDMNDPNSTPNRYLAEKKKQGYISTFRLQEELGTKPNNLYIGQQPSASARLAHLPTPYEALGWEAERRESMERPPAWFLKYLGGKAGG